MSNYHIPVLLKETLQYLNIQKGAWYVDCNLGGGGHTQAIIAAGGKVLGIDLDKDALQEVARNNNLTMTNQDSHLQAISNNLILYQSNFSFLGNIIEELNLNKVAGVLFDLGVSSYQLETPNRGFSFNQDAKLDMRMDQLNQTVTAADLINGLHEGELAELFLKLGEERFAKPIARKIVEFRKNKRIETTNELANIILSIRHRTPNDPTHPATRVFQALRIAVNDELNSLKEVLPQTVDILSPGGRLVVISFHSLEDRIVKNFLKDEQQKGSITILTHKPVIPLEEEIDFNPRSHSGKLRAAVKS